MAQATAVLKTSAGVRWTSVVAWVLLAGCDGMVVPPPNVRFGQTGQVVVEVVTPLNVVLPAASGEGELTQILTWRSSGEWQLFESVAYRGETGSETTTRSPGIPAAFASEYATLIAQINETPGLDLFINELDAALDPECAPTRSRVTLRVQDRMQAAERSWARCASGPLGSLNAADSGPDPHASRVIFVSKLIHDRTLGQSAVSVYFGSIPYATLAEGEKAGEIDLTPRAFLGGPGPDDEPVDWREFWDWLAEGSPPPSVDWSTDMVVLGSDGPKYEAGTTVQVRRIEPVRGGALVKLVESVPGDFCSPAAVVQTPYHLVIAPRTPPTVRFGTYPDVELVSCGL